MTFGNETINVPPKPTSQTSCHDHNGPMAEITRRRSASVLPTKYCNMPAPKSKPSSTTNMMSMKVKMAYQISIMGHLRFDGWGELSGDRERFRARRETDKAARRQNKDP